MLDTDENKFKELVTLIAENDGQEFSETKIRMWWKVFKDYSVTDIEKAVFAHISDPVSGKYTAKPAHIIDKLPRPNVDCEDRAILAWMEIEKNIRKVGAYGNLEMEDKQALVAVKNMCSWQELCHTPVDKLAFRRNEFIQNYKAVEGVDTAYIEKLDGIEALENQRSGHLKPIGLVEAQVR